jgi:membrane fusion protein, multidrug efflux system
MAKQQNSEMTLPPTQNVAPKRKPRTWLRFLIMLVLVVVLIAAIAFGFYRHIQTLIASAPKPTPATVSTMVADVSDWQPQITSVGSLAAVQGVDVATQVAGVVSDIPVKSGGTVKTNDELVQLNIDPDKAQLVSLQAAADLSTKTLKRDTDLLATKTTSQSVVDADAADLASKNALVAQAQALIEQKTLKAPFAGDLGIVQVNLGQYLSPGTVIVTIQDLSEMNADFLVPQDKIGSLTAGLPVTVTLTNSDKSFPGKITAVTPKIDTSTRNVTVRATIANPEKQLIPGMFVTVAVDVGQPQQLLTLPVSAITYNSYGATVFVADKNDKGDKIAKQVFVTTGQTRGDQVAVLKGIDKGQEVITSGQLKLKSGAAIVVDNTVLPPNDPNAKPQEK